MRRSLIRFTLGVIPAFVPLVFTVSCNDLASDPQAPQQFTDGGLNASLDAGRILPDATSYDAGDDGAPDAAVDGSAGSFDDASADASPDASWDAETDLDAMVPTDGRVDADQLGDAGSSDATAPIDADFDAGFDGGRDSGFDAGFDAGRGSGFDGGFDAGFDAGWDGGFDAGFDAGLDSTPPAVDAAVDTGMDTTLWFPTLTLSLDPSLDTAEDAVKATTIHSVTLLDRGGARVTAASGSGTSLQLSLVGVSPGDYFLDINNDPDDLVPTRIDDPTADLVQRVGQKLRDSRIGPPGAPAYRVRTWSKGQGEKGLVYFADGSREQGKQPYFLLGYAASSAELHVLGTGETLLSLSGLSNPHTLGTADSFDGWILKSNDGSRNHGVSCSGCGCHGSCTQKPQTFAADSQNGWCYTCHYGTAGTAAGFVDPLHTPPFGCDQSCTGDGHCTTTLAKSQSSPRALALSGDLVYWSNFGDGSIWSASRSCGQAKNVLAGGNHPSSIALSGGYVYYNDWETATLGGGVLRAPIDGSAAPAFVATVREYPSNIVVDANSVYWTENATNIVRSAPSGGWPITMAALQHVNAGLLLDATSIYFAGIGASVADGFVGSIPVTATGPVVPTTLAGSQYFPISMAKDAANIYWTTYDGMIRSVPISGGAIATLATGQGTVGAIATDGVNIYWAATGASGGAAIMKLPVSGNGSPVAVALGQQQPDTIVVDDTSVYWTDSIAGTVMKLSPK